MKAKAIKVLHRNGDFWKSTDWADIQTDLLESVKAVRWPPGGPDFAINPTRKKNGVREINYAFRTHLLGLNRGWENEWWPTGGAKPEAMERVGSFDVARPVGAKHFVVEWETGNISSSHRSLNRMALGILNGVVQGGVLLLPTTKLYPYLTDRIGNYDELAPYFPLYKKLRLKDFVLAVLPVEHDRLDPLAPLIPQGSDGNAK